MLTVMAVALLLLIVVLSIPLTLIFRLSWPQVTGNAIDVQWAFGLVRVRLPNTRSSTTPAKNDKEEQIVASWRGTFQERKPLAKLVWNKKLYRRVFKFTTDMWHVVKKENLNLNFRIGLDGPAETGQLWAFVGPLSVILARLRDVSINIEPDFSDTRFDIDSNGSVKLMPLQVIYITVAFLLSPIVWRTLRQLRTVN